jgi:predicted DNA-binding transcriptional regulator AlpA
MERMTLKTPQLTGNYSPDKGVVMSNQPMVPSFFKLLTIDQVASRYGVAARTIWRWEALGHIPRAVRMTRATVRWRADDIEKHLLSLKSQ